MNSNTHDNKPRGTVVQKDINTTTAHGRTRFESSQAELDKKNATINSVDK
jgi:hypothetical protein